VDFLRSLLFESPTKLASLCAFVCLVLLVLWRRTGTAGRRRAFLGALAASLVLLALQAVVVTDHERIVQLLSALADAAERADLGAIEPSIDDSYRDNYGDRAALLARIRDRLTRYTIRNVSLSAFEVTVDGDEATAGFRVVADMNDRDSAFPATPSRWEVGLIRRGGVWRVRSVRLLRLGPLEATGAGGGLGW